MNHRWSCVRQFAPVLALALFACNGVSWPSERIVTSLRVLGVEAEPATAVPGQKNQLWLDCVDGSNGPNSDMQCNIEVAWFCDCNNPPKNDPTKCLSHYSDWVPYLAPKLRDTPPSPNLPQFQVTQQSGPTPPASVFEFQPPDDILQHELDVDGTTVHYGTSYVFFIACHGTLVPVAGLVDQLPVQCRDTNSNALLDQRHYVIGMTTLYAYDKIVNFNPAFAPAQWDSTPLHHDQAPRSLGKVAATTVSVALRTPRALTVTPVLGAVVPTTPANPWCQYAPRTIQGRAKTTIGTSRC